MRGLRDFLAPLGLAGLFLSGSATATPRPDLTGRVTNTNSEPIRAGISIYTAGPKAGTSVFCPSCYLDCKKSAQTDADGRFKIESLDPDLRFRILVTGEGCESKFVSKVDPATGPLDVTLKPLDLSVVPLDRIVRGRVVDAKGERVAQAEVNAWGICDKTGRQMWGTIDAVNPTTTDARGEFVLVSKTPLRTLDVEVDARGFAKKNFSKLLAGDKAQDLTVGLGANVEGRIVWQGKPLANITVNISSTDRSVDNFTGDFEIATDADGRFEFLNLPPNVKYSLAGSMGDLAKYGHTAAMQIDAGADGTTADAGDLVVKPGNRLAGQFKLLDGGKVPPRTRLLIDRSQAWDSIQPELDADGRFDVGGIPPEQIRLALNVPEYHLSSRNVSVEPSNPSGLIGRVDHDITNLVILMEKGAGLEPDYNADNSDNIAEQPLRGIEGGTNRSAPTNAWVVSGLLTDAGSSQPIEHFTVTPTRNQGKRDQRNKALGENGKFTVYVNKHFDDPELIVEAEGYLPVRLTAPQENKNGLNVQLTRGSGPNGIVLLPDGKPASGVSVALLCTGHQGMQITADAGINAWPNMDLLKTTHEDGHFSFAPVLDLEKIVASSVDGFALVSPADLTANSNVVLQPWGKVKGVLNRPSGPGTNENLDLLFGPAVLNGRWVLDSGAHTVTDDKGNFEFDRVPPVAMIISYRIPFGDRGWQNWNLDMFDVVPGKTTERRIDASARLTNDAKAFAQPQAKQTGRTITGMVKLPNGTPATKAQVGENVPNAYLAIGKANLEVGSESAIKTTTDANGQFSLPEFENAKALVAVSEEGCGEMTFAPGSNNVAITLQPWGKITGVCHIGDRIGSNQWVQLQSDNLNLQYQYQYQYQSYRTRTDNEGRFEFSYVPPGEQRIYRQIPIRNGFNSGPPVFVDVPPGQVVETKLGGAGRTVVGRAAPPNPDPDFNWKNVAFTLHTTKYMPTKNFKTGEEWQAWWATEEGRFARKHNRYYTAEFSTNGSFRFEDVDPEDYTLSARFMEEMDSHLSSITVLGNTNVVVTAIDGTDKSKPYDIGSVQIINTSGASKVLNQSSR